MEAKLFTYTTEKLNNSEKSTLSKKLNGYTDKSNKSRYEYHRKGILNNIKHIKISNNTFIIETKHWKTIKKELKDINATIKEWDITLKKS